MPHWSPATAMGTLYVQLLRAEGIRNVEWRLAGPQDPYTKLSIGPVTHKSLVHWDGGTAPQWNQFFKFFNIKPEDELICQLLDKNTLVSDVPIGKCRYQLKEFIEASIASGQSEEEEFHLPVKDDNGVCEGVLVINLRYVLGPAGTMMRSAVSPGTPWSPQQPAQVPTPTINWILDPPYRGRDGSEEYKKVVVLSEREHASIYQVKKLATGRDYAMKVIMKDALLADPQLCKDVRMEVEVLARLKGFPNILTFDDMWEDRHHIYQLMELCQGGDLLEAITTRGTFTEKDAASLMREIITIISQQVHDAGVVHRDVRPDHVLLTSNQDDASIKLTGFRMATFLHAGQQLTDPAGSLSFAAPEMLAAGSGYGQPVDMWSCGVALYAMLCGSIPWSGDSAEEMLRAITYSPLDLQFDPWPSISEPAKDCVRRLLEKDPSLRASAADILQHEWLREGGCASGSSVIQVDRLKDFTRMNKLSQEALKVIARSLPAEELLGLRDVFKQLDTDQSGTLTKDEFLKAIKGQAINAAEVEQLVGDLTGPDQDIDYGAFIAAMMNKTMVQREQELMTAFQAFDLDRSGHITKAELRHVLDNLDTKRISADQIDQIVTDVDKDGDGQISFGEFKAMLQNLRVD